MNENLQDLFTRLSAPFHPNDIEWRAGATNSDKTKSLALAYITSRAVMDRLDEVVGPNNWKDEYAPGPQGGVICGLSLRIDGEWITKWDGADNPDIEAIKGGLSDAFKRAGYKWGIGRYLYKLESVWVPCEVHGKTIVLKSTPPLPSWALPASTRTPVVIQREKEVLAELGYPEEQPAPEPVVQPAVQIAPIAPGPSAPKPNGANSNSKRATSWSAELVRAVLNAKLASTVVEAVRLLNQSDLDANASPEQAVARIKSARNG